MCYEKNMLSNKEFWDDVYKPRPPRQKQKKEIESFSTPKQCPQCGRKYAIDIYRRTDGRHEVMAVLDFKNIPIKIKQICPECQEKSTKI